MVLFIYIECWIGRVFFLQYFKYIMPQPSIFHVSDVKWDANLIKDLCAWCFVSCFFLAIFKILSLSFDSLIIMCLGVYPVCVCVCVCSSLSHVKLFERPWIVAHKAPLPMEFSRQEYCSGLPFPSPGDLPNLGIEPSPLYCRQILYHLTTKEALRLSYLSLVWSYMGFSVLLGHIY